MSAGESSGSAAVMPPGSHLRRLRESRGITREAAGYSIRASESKISRMELGRVSFKTRDVEDLLTLYGITDEAERTSLVSLAKEANVAGWWHSYSDALPSWFPTYVGLEGAAHLIRSYEVQFVHGLLQTEAYAHAVVARGMRGASPTSSGASPAPGAAEVPRLREGPGLSSSSTEAALRRPYGDREVMRGQLQHLIEVSERSNVRLQVMPFSFGGHSGESGSFTDRFPESDLSDVVYLEQLTSALYLENARTSPSTKAPSSSCSRTVPGPPRVAICCGGCSSSPDLLPAASGESSRSVRL